MRKISTIRLTLEPQVVAHAEEMFAILRDPALYTYENEPPSSVQWLRERFARLESRQSPDGGEQWLNWVIRLPSFGLIGFVQATVFSSGEAAVAYVLSSRQWGRGLAHEATSAMLAELAEQYDVRTFVAILKRENLRSQRLLDRLGFSLAASDAHARHQVEPDEMLMSRSSACRDS